jgi:hypothetical protein
MARYVLDTGTVTRKKREAEFRSAGRFEMQRHLLRIETCRPRLIAVLTVIATTTQHWIPMLRLMNRELDEEACDSNCKAPDYGNSLESNVLF